MCRNAFAPSPKNLRGVAVATVSKFFGKDGLDWQIRQELECRFCNVCSIGMWGVTMRITMRIMDKMRFNYYNEFCFLGPVR